MATKLQSAIYELIEVFHSYSGKEGDKYKLNKAELKKLFQEELPEFRSPNDPAEVDKIMKDLDENKDGEVDFQEFVFLIAVLTVACNEFFSDYEKSREKVKKEDAGSKKN